MDDRQQAAGGAAEAPGTALSGTTAGPTVRDATFEVLRQHGMTTIFGNPGSTELPFLTGFPEDFRYVLGLHEGSVVGMAVGFAQATRGPVAVNLHTAAGLGNSMGALVTAWHNRAPLVLIVGQQARQHLALQPFLAGGQLDRMAEPFAKSTVTPIRPEDVPGAVAQAVAVATAEPTGPAVVVVPMDDWEVHLATLPAPHRVLHGGELPDSVIAELAGRIDRAHNPVVVAGAGVDRAGAWSGAVALAQRLGAPVWQEPMAARFGFPQDHPLYAGMLPPSRRELRGHLEGHDLVLVLGAPVFRYYLPETGPMLPDGCAVIQITSDQDEASRTPVGLSVVARLDTTLSRLATTVTARTWAPANRAGQTSPTSHSGQTSPAGHSGTGTGLAADGGAAVGSPGGVTPKQVVAVLKDLVPPHAVVVEECPSVRPLLDADLPTTVQGGWSATGGGWLGYGLSGAVGLAMGDPGRPVVCVAGDGSTVFGLQALWSAARYQVPLVFCVLVNEQYGVLVGQTRRYDDGERIPGTTLPGLDISSLARGFGVEPVRVADRASLAAALRSALSRLDSAGHHAGPALIEVQLAT